MHDTSDSSRSSCNIFTCIYIRTPYTLLVLFRPLFLFFFFFGNHTIHTIRTRRGRNAKACLHCPLPRLPTGSRSMCTRALIRARSPAAVLPAEHGRASCGPAGVSIAHPSFTSIFFFSIHSSFPFHLCVASPARLPLLIASRRARSAPRGAFDSLLRCRLWLLRCSRAELPTQLPGGGGVLLVGERALDVLASGLGCCCCCGGGGGGGDGGGVWVGRRGKKHHDLYKRYSCRLASVSCSQEQPTPW